MRILQAIIITSLMFAQGSASAQCQGDANGNGFVNFSDFGAVQANFGLPCSAEARFIDNGDGTISDLWTQLVWEKKVRLDSSIDSANLHDADNTYRWSGVCGERGPYCQPDGSSEEACIGTTSPGGVYGCQRCISSSCNSSGVTVWQWISSVNASSFAGHSDWRIPTISELESILDRTDGTAPATYSSFHSSTCGGSCSDTSSPACSCTKSGNYWSASTYAPEASFAWFANLGDGFVDALFKADLSYSVRAVRGGPM